MQLEQPTFSMFKSNILQMLFHLPKNLIPLKIVWTNEIQNPYKTEMLKKKKGVKNTALYDRAL